jgi:predicted membrane protein (TIGR00267 family)
MLSRISLARDAFLNRDINKTKEPHRRKKIHQAIHRHEEPHALSFNLPQIILGGQDGLVNVLGVILGVAAATSSSQIVIAAGLAATFAESVSMAAVAYTSKLAEADYYQSEYEREKWEINNVPEGEREEIRALYENYGFNGGILDEIVEKITSNKDNWLKAMMEQELRLEPVERKQALPSGIVVGVSAFFGSLVPLAPFFFFPIMTATIISLLVTAAALFVIGYYKAKVTLGRSLIEQGVEMLLIGMVSALVGYLVGLIFQVNTG